MNCEVEGFLGGVCRGAQAQEPDFCQAQNQAATDLTLSVGDLLLATTVSDLEPDIARTYAECPRLEEVIAGIREELARRNAAQNQNPPPPTAI